MSIKYSSIVDIFIMSFLICVNSYICIHIVRPHKKDEIFNSNGDLSNKSQFSKMCSSISQTANYLGKDALKLYKLCDGKFNLLGKSSKPIKENNPFCFKALDEFFCTKKIVNRDDKKDSVCKDEDLVKLLLTTIKGCLEVIKYIIINSNQLKMKHYEKMQGIDVHH